MTISASTATASRTTSRDEIENPPPDDSAVTLASIASVRLPLMVAELSEVFSTPLPDTAVMGPGNVAATVIEPRFASPSRLRESSGFSDCASLTTFSTRRSPSLVIDHGPSVPSNTSFSKVQV